MAAGAAGGTTTTNTNNKKRVRHNTHYIGTGLGDGSVNVHAHDGSGDLKLVSPKKPNTRTRQQQQHNHANDVLDEEFIRKNLLETKKLNNPNNNKDHHNVRGMTAHDVAGAGGDKGGAWDFYYFSDGTGGSGGSGGGGADGYGVDVSTAAPWQMSAFALLGAVILLSALFLHVLADAHSDQQHHYHGHQHHNGHSYSRRRRNTGHRSNNHNSHASTSTSHKVTKRKKTDDWSDDAEEELLSASLRGYRGEPEDTTDGVASHHHQVSQPAALYYPYQQPKLQHRKNTTSGGLGVIISNTGIATTTTAVAASTAAGTLPGPAATAAAATASIITPAPFQHRNYYINQSGGAVVATTLSNRATSTATINNISSRGASTTTNNNNMNVSSHHSNTSYQNRTPLALNRPTVTIAAPPPPPPVGGDGSSTVPGMIMPPLPVAAGLYQTPLPPPQQNFAMRRSPPYDNTTISMSRHNLNARVLSGGVSSFGSLEDYGAGLREDAGAEESNAHSNNNKTTPPLKPCVTIQVPQAAATQQQQQSLCAPHLSDGTENDCSVLRNHVFQSSPDEGARGTVKLSDLIVEKTPRVRNGRITIMPGDKPNKGESKQDDNQESAAGAAVGAAANTPLIPTKLASTVTPKTPVAQMILAHQDSTSPVGTPIMPFLPNLDPDHHIISKPPRSINVDDLHLYMMMESGNVTWCQQQQLQQQLSQHHHQGGVLASASEDSGILATAPTPVKKTMNNNKEQPLPSPMILPAGHPHRLVAPDLMMLGPSISECCSSDYDDDASLDDNDPRKNIRHKRDDLTSSTDAAQSLQGEVNFSELQMIEVIGGGGFGQVWRAVWVGTPVAVKVLTGSAQSKNVPRVVLEEFAAEINLLRGMRHPNICLYMGACLRPPNRAIITELAANGSLWDALRLPLCPPYSCCDGISSRESWPLVLYRPDPTHGAPPAALSSRLSPPVPPRGSWPWILVKRVARGAARGMAYLHSGSPPVLHRDLKSANILLDESYTAKVCDFGLSRLKSQDRSMTGNCGTVQWMAPEVLANQSYNEKADVFSYGIICWELLTRQCPYEGMSAIQCAMAVLNRNQRPEIPRWCPPPLHALIRRCIKKDPKERPTFTQILDALDQMP